MDNTAGPAATDVAYENTADEAWARQAFDLLLHGQLQVQAFDTDGVVSAQVWGMCPRCAHELNVQMTLSTPVVGLRGARGLWAALAQRDVRTGPGVPDFVEVGCGCGRGHPGAPEQVSGCGVSFRLPTTPADTPPSS